MTDVSPSGLISQILELNDWMDAEQKRFDVHLRPQRERLETLKNQLQDYLNQTGGKSFKCEHGTAYLSTVTTPSIDGEKTDFLDWVLDDWDHRGAMLNIGAPLKAGLQDYQDANNGQLPPMIKTSSITRVNVRRS